MSTEIWGAKLPGAGMPGPGQCDLSCVIPAGNGAFMCQARAFASPSSDLMRLT